jgi:hypothetical protein
MQKESKEVLRLMTKVLSDPRIAIGQRDQLLKAMNGEPRCLES